MVIRFLPGANTLEWQDLISAERVATTYGRGWHRKDVQELVLKWKRMALTFREKEVPGAPGLPLSAAVLTALQDAGKPISEVPRE